MRDRLFVRTVGHIEKEGVGKGVLLSKVDSAGFVVTVHSAQAHRNKTNSSLC